VSKFDSLCGYVPDQRAKEEFLASQPVQFFSCAPGSGKGKRAAHWGYYLALDPGAYSERQQGPDCTSHGSRNALDSTRCCNIATGRKVEDFFKRTATEPTYGARGGGRGMSPARASRFLRDVGFFARQKYEGVDLSSYDYSVGERWGSRGVPDAIQKQCGDHKVSTITLVRTMDDLFDCLFNGYGVHSGQEAAWSESPNGIYHPRVSDPWGHDMNLAGYDATKEFWPYDVVFIANSWGGWNKPIVDWPTYLPPPPPGMIVSRAEDAEVCVDSEDCWAFSDAEGYEPRELPDAGTIGMLMLKKGQQ
jgi:hypothetical protein